MLSRDSEPKLHARVLRHCARMNAAFERKDYKDALHVCTQALGLLPGPRTQWQAASALLAAAGDALFRLGRHADSRDVLLEALTCPDARGNPYMHLRHGQAQVELGELEQARDALHTPFTRGGEKLFAAEDPKYLTIACSRR